MHLDDGFDNPRARTRIFSRLNQIALRMSGGRKPDGQRLRPRLLGLRLRRLRQHRVLGRGCHRQGL